MGRLDNATKIEIRNMVIYITPGAPTVLVNRIQKALQQRGVLK